MVSENVMVTSVDAENQLYCKYGALCKHHLQSGTVAVYFEVDFLANYVCVMLYLSLIRFSTSCYKVYGVRGYFLIGLSSACPRRTKFNSDRDLW